MRGGEGRDWVSEGAAEKKRRGEEKEGGRKGRGRGEVWREMGRKGERREGERS